MDLTLDPDSPVPPSHQLAQGLRYRIAVGELEAGDRLPSLREAAEELGVHYLTVRKAYLKLQEDGLVESERGKGTWVSPVVGHRTGDPSLRRFLARVLEDGWREHALRPPELVEVLSRFADAGGDLGVDPAPAPVAAVTNRTGWTGDDAGDPHDPDPPFAASSGTVHVVECNRPQARDYASQLDSLLDRPVRPWLLDDEEPPDGLIVGTYFHFNDIRRRWPHRAADLRFVAVKLDPGLAEELGADAPLERGTLEVRLCEVDDVRLHSVLPDLSQILPEPRFRIEQLHVDHPGEALADDDPSPVLFAPRLWARLEEEQRRDPRARLLRYVMDPSSTESLS